MTQRPGYKQTTVNWATGQYVDAMKKSTASN